MVDPGQPEPRQRVLVLGASNVTRGLRAFCLAANGRSGGPIDILAAIGNGRSYGYSSRFLGRVLPSIRACELWEEWTRREPLPTYGVITDIGNDIVYGASPEQILAWVRECVARMTEVGVEVTVTGLPLASLQQLSGSRFRLMRALLFPSSNLTLERALSAATELEAGVRQLAAELGLRWSPASADWYGLDPIHIRRRHQRAAWEQILATAPGDVAVDSPWCRLPSWYWNRLRPRRVWLWGREYRQEQPAWRGADGCRLSLY